MAASVSDSIVPSSRLPLTHIPGSAIPDSHVREIVNLALGQNRITELIATGAPLETTLHELLCFLEKELPDMYCSVLLLDPDGVRLRHGAAPRLPKSYVEMIDGAPIGPNVGSCGTAAYRREPVVVSDIDTDPLWDDYRALAQAHGLRACWSTPIIAHDNKVLGTFAMYFKKPNSPGPLHEQLTQIALHVATIAIGKAQREHVLFESEERYRLLSLATNDAVWDWDLSKNTLWWNDGVTELFGYPRTMVENSLAWWIERVHPDDRERVHHTLQAAADAGAMWCEEYRFLRHDETYADIQDRGYALSNEHGITTRMIGTMQDITERKRAEAKILRLNRTYAMLSGINSAIVRCRNRTLLFGEACRIAVELGQLEIAWIGQYDASVNQFEVAAHHGDAISPNILDQLAQLATSHQMNEVGLSLDSARPVACNAVDPQSAIGRLLASTELQALMALPFVVDEKVVGALVLHSKEREFFDTEEVKLLSELADNLAFALGYMEQEAKVKELAYNDPLTRLPNRTALQCFAADVLVRANPEVDRLALVLMNLNHFRDINDSLGHQNGDLLLQRVAAKLRFTLAMSGQVASLGGDEFAILMPRVEGEADVQQVLDEIAEALQHPMNIADIPIRVEASFGVAIYPVHGETLDVLWQHADVALRTAKERHENFLVYSENIDHYDPQRIALLGELRSGMENNELIIHYQPKIDLASGRVHGLEALVRWNHRSRGLIYPDSFIPLAEQTGLINPLTTAVVKGALRHGAELLSTGLTLELSVNLSARNLHDPNFCPELLRLVSDAGFPLSQLTLEITESAIMSDPQRAKTALEGLSAAGIQLSMDDFGIGQSSLTYLKDLPLSRMKIDKSFVMDFKEARNRAIVRSAIDLGRNLGLQVTAEGIEDNDTYLALRELGCHVGQGYYFGKPMPLDALRVWLKDSGWV